MANRPKGYGLTAEVNRKIQGKYSTDHEAEARNWMSEVLGDGSVPTGEVGMNSFHALLKDGTILCRLINTIEPGSVKKINDSKMAFKQMENISAFLDACERYGCAKTDLFQTVALYENQNMVQVICTLEALGRKAQKRGYNGPTFGAKESAENRRSFTDEQLRAGEGVIGLQAGSNKGASQAGMNLGNMRHIID